jgi:hypothetical protein
MAVRSVTAARQQLRFALLLRLLEAPYRGVSVGTPRALLLSKEIPMTQYFARYVDEEGNPVELEGESVESIQNQLPEDFDRRLVVYDEPGFVRGWVGKGGFNAQ